MGILGHSLKRLISDVCTTPESFLIFNDFHNIYCFSFSHVSFYLYNYLEHNSPPSFAFKML